MLVACLLTVSQIKHVRLQPKKVTGGSDGGVTINKSFAQL